MLERTNQRLFISILGVTALFIAGCAAFFSVRGISLLFSGSMISVAIMATSLEVGKLMSASFLYRLRDQMSIIMKFYLTLAVVVLIGITSLGVYGFLSDAFDKTISKVELYEADITRLEQQNNAYQLEIKNIQNTSNVIDTKTNDSVDRYQKIYDDYVKDQRTRQDNFRARLKELDAAVAKIEAESGGLFSSKDKRLRELKESQVVERESINNSIIDIDEKLKVEYDKFRAKIETLRDNTEKQPDRTDDINKLYSNIRTNQQSIIDIKTQVRDTDIGSFKFIADAFDVELKNVVKWFILIICLVFDPLAVVLVVGLNMMILDTLTGQKKIKKLK